MCRSSDQIIVEIGDATLSHGIASHTLRVAVDGVRSIRVVRVVTAFECGAIVKPDGLRNQIVGANIMGLGGALFEAIEFANGRIIKRAILAVPCTPFS